MLWNSGPPRGVYVIEGKLSGNVVRSVHFGAGGRAKITYNVGDAMRLMAGAASLGDFAGALGIREEESAIVAELKAGSEDAYAWLIGEFHQPIYSLVYRIVKDPADAADTTQEVFLKVFHGIKHFHGESSLKTWIYRIAVHEASNRRRWWFRHKSREMSIEPPQSSDEMPAIGIRDTLMYEGDSPFDSMLHEEVRVHVEEELRKVAEPYRTTVILRDLEGMSYEDIAEITQVTLGTVKSRLTRGREALRQRLAEYVREVGPQLGLQAPEDEESQMSRGYGRRVEVTQ